ncbi:hypothetical protein BX616_007502, partial [Lobosporangium transversale]
MGINANGEEEPLPYVEYVEYLLHHTFEQPLRKVTEYPFMLQEKGWGEFDMKIMLYFADKSTTPYSLDHDLNFQLAHYEVSHTLTFKPDLKPSFLKLLNQPVETISSRDTHNSNGAQAKTNKRRREDTLKPKSKRIKDDASSDDDSSAAASDDWNDEVDIHALADKFQQLDADDLVDLVKLVKANQTADMYVKEDGE